MVVSTKKDESDAHILQHLKDKAMKLTLEHLHEFVRYHSKRDQVIIMQREAAEVLRESVNWEFNSHFDLPFNSSSTTNVQGSIYLKLKTQRCWWKRMVLGQVQSLSTISMFKKLSQTSEKREKDEHFDIRESRVYQGLTTSLEQGWTSKRSI